MRRNLCYKRHMHILVTGASGLIGGELAGVLAAQNHAVTVLLHRNRLVQRNDGTEVPLLPEGQSPGPGEVGVCTGGVPKERLGLPPDDYARLQDTLDLVVHVAAITEFDADPSLLQAVNVDGTANVVRLCTDGSRKIPLLHVSTAYVCGETSDQVRETDPVGDGRFANGYEASKARAEALVREAMQDGLRASIARPSIVVGAFADGVLGQIQGVYTLIRLAVEGRVRVLPVAPEASLDLVPIDHVIDGLMHLVGLLGDPAHPPVPDVVQLVSGNPVPVATLVGMAADYPQFFLPEMVDPAKFDTTMLSPTAQRMHGQFIARFGSYLRRAPQFRDDALLACGGRPCPPTDVAFLRRLLDWCVSTGFLPAHEARKAVDARS
jgi:2-alkyl-3-oxoalkanoate reductase